MTELERKIRKQNNNVDEGNMDIFIDDYMEDKEVHDLVDDEELNMNNMTEDYMDGYDYNEYEDVDIGEYD